MKIFILFLLILLSSFIGGMYGALYDQLTYTISPEFFTKFRFGLFNIDPDMNERIAVAKIGFLNSWSIGAILGSVLAFAGLINSDISRMFNYTLRAFMIALLIAFITGLIGWFIGPYTGQADPDLELKVIDTTAFKTVVNMNIFTSAGGVIGMFVGIFYQLYGHKKYKLKTSMLDN